MHTPPHTPQCYHTPRPKRTWSFHPSQSAGQPGETGKGCGKRLSTHNTGDKLNDLNDQGLFLKKVPKGGGGMKKMKCMGGKPPVEVKNIKYSDFFKSHQGVGGGGGHVNAPLKNP